MEEQFSPATSWRQGTSCYFLHSSMGDRFRNYSWTLNTDICSKNHCEWLQTLSSQGWRIWREQSAGGSTMHSMPWLHPRWEHWTLHQWTTREAHSRGARETVRQKNTTETDSLTEQVQERRCCVSQDLLRNQKPAELLTEDHYKKNVPGGKRNLVQIKIPMWLKAESPGGWGSRLGSVGERYPWFEMRQAIAEARLHTGW